MVTEIRACVSFPFFSLIVSNLLSTFEFGLLFCCFLFRPLFIFLESQCKRFRFQFSIYICDGFVIYLRFVLPFSWIFYSFTAFARLQFTVFVQLIPLMAKFMTLSVCGVSLSRIPKGKNTSMP